jgi:methyl-accepting chemotaxis protein
MFRSIRTRIIAATAGCLAVALLLNTIINYQVTRRDNAQAQREMLVSTCTSHGMAIADWVSSKMTMIASLDNVTLSNDPVPQYLQMARASDFSNVYVGTHRTGRLQSA